MSRTLDVATQGAIRNLSSVVPRNFIVVTAKDRSSGDPVIYCFWDDVETVTVSILDENGDTVSHNFEGDGAVLSLDPIPMRIGIDVNTVVLTLSPLHATVQDLLRGSDPRNASVEIYRGLLDPASHLLVAAPRIRFLGSINGAPIDTAAVDGESAAALQLVSHTRELTRTSPAKKSDAQQQLRSGDRFRRYTATAGDVSIWWGEHQKKSS